MNNEIIKTSAANLPVNAPAAVFSQTGDSNTQIAHANNINYVYNIILPSSNGSANDPDIRSGVRLNPDYYNLFVIGDESFDSGHFIVPKERALTESVQPDIAVKFAGLSDNAVAEIKTFPSLFASENHLYARTDDEHNARFGIVTDLKIQENGIKIYFYIISSLPQQRLNEIAFNLALARASSFNELNRTHWAIKKVNLLEELSAAGIRVLAAA